MSRQLNGSRPPYKHRETPLQPENGGTGAITPIAAMAALGGIHISQVGLTAGKLAQLNEEGVLPESLFSRGGSGTTGFSISGPKTLAYGQEAVYYITNAGSFSEVAVSISSGTIHYAEDGIVVQAPVDGDHVDLSIGIRTIRIPLVNAYIEKPTILMPLQGDNITGSVVLNASPFYSEPENFSASWWVLTDNQTYTLANDTTSFSLSGRSGGSGTAYVIYDGVRYDMGKGQTERIIRRGANSTLTWGVTGTGELGIQEASAVNPHTHTEWEVSDTADFANIVWATTQYAHDNVDLTSALAELTAGTYFVRCRYISREEVPA